MAISGEIIQKLLPLLRPLLEDEKARRGYLIRALGTDSPVLYRLVWNTPADVFITGMVKELEAFGKIPPDKPALCAFLEVIREEVGDDIKVSIDELLRQIKEEPKKPKSPINKKYAQLNNLLAQGEWQEADIETLRVMLQVTRREGYLDEECILSFPCMELRTINQLWVEYSYGRFGFSVQKRIFDNANQNGGVFLQRVGWKKSSSTNMVDLLRNPARWKYYGELTFTLNAPEGHIPAAWCWVPKLNKGGPKWVDLLGARLVNCGIV